MPAVTQKSVVGPVQAAKTSFAAAINSRQTSSCSFVGISFIPFLPAHIGRSARPIWSVRGEIGNGLALDRSDLSQIRAVAMAAGIAPGDGRAFGGGIAKGERRLLAGVHGDREIHLATAARAWKGQSTGKVTAELPLGALDRAGETVGIIERFGGGDRIRTDAWRFCRPLP